MQYIDKQGVLSELQEVLNDKICPLPVAATVEQIIETYPAADVAPVIHATWNGVEYDGYADGFPVYNVWECSNCGEEHCGEENTLTRFCPHCGAKMNAK